MKMNERYTIPKIVKFKEMEKSWYVYFRYDSKLLRFKKGVNYIKDFKKRTIYIEALRSVIEQKLKGGWNPLITELPSFDNTLKINQALKFALDEKAKNISPATKTAYTTTYKFFSKAVLDLNLDNLYINDVKRVHIKTVFDRIKINESWSNKSYNKNLGYLKSLFTELLQWDKIESNPAFNIKPLKVEITEANITATDKEMIAIKDHLLQKFPQFYYFIATIFHTGIRPKEILSLKVGMINLTKNEIRIPADITKTSIERVVPINQFMKVYLSEMLSTRTPKSWFLFGTIREKANERIKRDTDFLPAPNLLTRKCSSKLWKRLVKDDLKININQYSMKNLGADKKIKSGMSVDSLRHLFGHTSKLTTLIYINKNEFIDQIIDKSPDL